MSNPLHGYQGPCIDPNLLNENGYIEDIQEAQLLQRIQHDYMQDYYLLYHLPHNNIVGEQKNQLRGTQTEIDAIKMLRTLDEIDELLDEESQSQAVNLQSQGIQPQAEETRSPRVEVNLKDFRDLYMLYGTDAKIAAFADRISRGSASKHDIEGGLPKAPTSAVYYNRFLSEIIRDLVDAEFAKSQDFHNYVDKASRRHSEHTIPFPRLFRIFDRKVQLEWRGTKKQPQKDILHELSFMKRTLFHLKMLRRFVDDRQTALDVVPLPGGENIPDPSLRAQWVARRRWIRFLNQKGLIAHENDVRAINEILEINRDAFAFLVEEVERTHEYPIHNSAYATGKPTRPEMGNYRMSVSFAWIRDAGDDLSAVLARSIASLVVPGPEVPVASAEAFVQAAECNMNIIVNDQPRWEAMLPEFYRVFTKSLQPITRMIMKLIQVELEFEECLRIEHVEDYLVEKRLKLFYDASYAAVEGERARANDMRNMEHSFRSCFRLIEARNDQRRDHHILRDWNRARPWRQLYYIFDSSQERWIRKGMKDLKWVGASQSQNQPSNLNPYQDGLKPSSKQNVLSQILMVHPLDLRRKEKWRGANKECGICLAEFEVGQTVMSTPCDSEHLYHVSCIWKWYDNFGAVEYSCPLCRQKVPLQASTVGVAGLSESAYGHLHMVNGRPYTGLQPDLSNSHVNLTHSSALPFDPILPENFNVHPFWLSEETLRMANTQWNMQHGWNPEAKKPVELHAWESREMRRQMHKRRRQSAAEGEADIQHMR